MENLKPFIDGATALFAFLAATAWFIGAKHPVGVPGFSGFYSEESARAIKEHGEKIQRGAMWNKRAAILTGLSAAAQCLSFGLPLAARLWR